MHVWSSHVFMVSFFMVECMRQTCTCRKGFCDASGTADHPAWTGVRMKDCEPSTELPCCGPSGPEPVKPPEALISVSPDPKSGVEIP